MREIENIFHQWDEYNCFGCAPHNPAGLHLKFFFDEENKEIVTYFDRDDPFNGFPGILHGGIQATLMDEIGFWIIYDQYKKFGLTVNLRVDYLKALTVPRKVEVRGRISRFDGKTADVETRIADEEGVVYAKGKLTFFLATRELWKKLTGKEEMPEFLTQFLK
jgi:uncharacterized protein (TIGR00369 family)